MWAKDIYSWGKIVRKKNCGRCIYCGAKSEEAHHVIAKSKLPELALLIENGVPVCRSCHDNLPVYPDTSARIYKRKIEALCRSLGVNVQLRIMTLQKTHPTLRSHPEYNLDALWDMVRERNEKLNKH